MYTELNHLLAVEIARERVRHGEARARLLWGRNLEPAAGRRAGTLLAAVGRLSFGRVAPIHGGPALGVHKAANG